MRRRAAAAALLAALLAAWGAAPPATAETDRPALAALSPAERDARQLAALAALATYRSGLARAVAYARAHPELFPAAPPAAPRVPAAAERDAVRGVWKSVLDYTLALDSLEAFHADFFLLDDAGARARSLRAAQGAFLAAYRFALDFIGLAEGDPKLAVILNDAVDDLGLPAGSYDRYKLRFLNVAAATRFTAYALAGGVAGPAGQAALARDAAQDADAILRAGRGRGAALTAANALNVLRGLGARAAFPVQAGVSAWMGDTKVARHQRSLIVPAQVGELRARMLPGDIMLQRREWYLSNIGLPGFWSHAALYVGTPEERRAFFDTDEVRRWLASRGELGGDLERLLARGLPSAGAATLPADRHPPRVLEAVSEGVVFTSLEHSADADAIVVLRPRLDRVAIATALARAWSYVGRPYDFDFDFQTDSALVCTELVYKAFEPSAGAGLHLRLEEILGRTAIPANAIARQFDEEYGTAAAQFDFLAFLDGREREGRAVPAGLEEFRASWRRPKWHVLVPDAPPLPAGPP